MRVLVLSFLGLLNVIDLTHATAGNAATPEARKIPLEWGSRKLSNLFQVSEQVRQLKENEFVILLNLEEFGRQNEVLYIVDSNRWVYEIKKTGIESTSGPVLGIRRLGQYLSSLPNNVCASMRFVSSRVHYPDDTSGHVPKALVEARTKGHAEHSIFTFEWFVKRGVFEDTNIKRELGLVEGNRKFILGTFFTLSGIAIGIPILRLCAYYLEKLIN